MEVNVRLVKKKPVFLLAILLLFAQVREIHDFHRQADQFGLSTAKFIRFDFFIFVFISYLKSRSVSPNKLNPVQNFVNLFNFSIEAEIRNSDLTVTFNGSQDKRLEITELSYTGLPELFPSVLPPSLDHPLGVS